MTRDKVLLFKERIHKDVVLTAWVDGDGAYTAQLAVGNARMLHAPLVCGNVDVRSVFLNWSRDMLGFAYALRDSISDEMVDEVVSAATSERLQ